MRKLQAKLSAIANHRVTACCAVMGFVCAVFLSLGQIAMAQNPQQSKGVQKPQKQSTAEGREIFESTCSGCHGLDGRGGERGPDISTRPQVVQLRDQELMGILRTGQPAAGMPPFASLGTTRLQALLAYLRFLQGDGVAVALAGDALEGKQLFFGKAHCADCHMVHGEGGFLGRDLSSYGATLSPKEVRHNIAGPAESASGKRMTTVKMRDSQTITGIIRNEDNFSIQLQSKDGAFHLLSKSDVAAIETLPEPIMPTNYGKILTEAEMDDLVNYLATVAKSAVKDPKQASDDDE